MGLDMYLKETVHLAHYEGLRELNDTYAAEFESAEKVLEALGMPIPTIEGSIDVSVTVMYWRKANAIHQWFVNNVQGGEDDCGTYEVDVLQLEELRDLCAEVIKGSVLVPGVVSVGQTATDKGWKDILEPGETVANPELAEALLPTTSGFFFGGTQYDQYYIEDLKETVKGLNQVLENKLDRSWFEYQSSW